MRTLNILDNETIARNTDWPLVVDALRKGHELPPAVVGDTLLQAPSNIPEGAKLLVRSAWIQGLGPGVKAVTVCPGNPARETPLPSVQGWVLLFDAEDGSPTALLDGVAITRWKTAGDSALGSQLLSREDADTLLMVGAGAQAEPLIRAHLSVRPALKRVLLWNRTPQRAQALAARLHDLAPDVISDVQCTDSLEEAVPQASIICTATMSDTPIIQGALLAPGTHLDLVGAYTPDMREADDQALQRGRIFVDSYDTTLEHIGELKDPLQRGVIKRESVLGDFHTLVSGVAGRQSPDDITVFKNGGGAHLDVMVAKAIADACHTA